MPANHPWPCTSHAGCSAAMTCKHLVLQLLGAHSTVTRRDATRAGPLLRLRCDTRHAARKRRRSGMRSRRLRGLRPSTAALPRRSSLRPPSCAHPRPARLRPWCRGAPCCCARRHVGLLAMRRCRACVFSRQDVMVSSPVAVPPTARHQGSPPLHVSDHMLLHACRAARQARDLAQQKSAVERVLEREVRSLGDSWGLQAHL